jgi:hypothetical protein
VIPSLLSLQVPREPQELLSAFQAASKIGVSHTPALGAVIAGVSWHPAAVRTLGRPVPGSSSSSQGAGKGGSFEGSRRWDQCLLGSGAPGPAKLLDHTRGSREVLHSPGRQVGPCAGTCVPCPAPGFWVPKHLQAPHSKGRGPSLARSSRALVSTLWVKRMPNSEPCPGPSTQDRRDPPWCGNRVWPAASVLVGAALWWPSWR